MLFKMCALQAGGSPLGCLRMRLRLSEDVVRFGEKKISTHIRILLSTETVKKRPPFVVIHIGHKS